MRKIPQYLFLIRQFLAVIEWTGETFRPEFFICRFTGVFLKSCCREAALKNKTKSMKKLKSMK